MRTFRLPSLGLLVLVFSTPNLWAGGSGLNVAVVVNENSTNSVQLGNYYCEQRQVPPQNLLRINWPGGNIQWTKTEFESKLLNPLLAMLSSRQLTNQIDYAVVSMDIPYRVIGPNGDQNSTTAALFYGFKTDDPGSLPSCTLPNATSNSYAGSEGVFRSTPPGTAGTNLLAMMLTASNLVDAKLIVDHGVASDGAFPTQTVYLAKSGDVDRNVRFVLFDNAIFNARLRGNYAMERVNASSIFAFGNILGFQSGSYNYGVASVAFAAGAMADNLASFGGFLFQDNGAQLNLLSLLAAGAVASYGTVVEPCNYLQKFPSPQNYFYQARGFSVAECYYQSLTNPYQGLLVGEPLAAPFAQPASGAWSSLPPDAVLSGTTNLSLQFTASDAEHPVQQVDLFLDGLFLQSLTNIPPRQNDVLNVTINGQSMNYTVTAGATTVKSVASGLAAVLNTMPNMNATKVRAFAHGDRLELQSFLQGRPGSQVALSVSNSIGSASALTTFVAASRTNFLDTIAFGIRGFSVTNVPQVGDYLQLTVTKTNGSQVIVAVTNTPPGTNLAALAETLLNAVNTNAGLLSSDGLVAEDVILYERQPERYGPDLHVVVFNLRARTIGWDAAQIQTSLTGSPPLLITPAGNVRLDENLADLEPRNHLYVTAGVTNLSFTFPFNTTTRADGYHELTALAYEGSHVRTQKRVSQSVRIQNSTLSATFTCLVCDTNTALEVTLQFSVAANTNNISKIELFSTGGSLAAVTNQSSVTFSVAGTNLGLGLHPFYALLTRSDGKQYRTETKLIRLVGIESPFSVQVSYPPVSLLWPGVAGRLYYILSMTNIANSFQVRGMITPTNTGAQWVETNTDSPQRFYRIRVSP